MTQTVLVIDDQWSMQELARIVFTNAGYRVLLAGDAATGLTLARTEMPDVTLVDMHLPEGDAWHLLNGLRQETETAALPVLLIAAQQPDEAWFDEWRRSAIACLHKPFTPAMLLRMVHQLLPREAMSLAS